MIGQPNRNRITVPSDSAVFIEHADELVLGNILSFTLPALQTPHSGIFNKRATAANSIPTPVKSDVGASVPVFPMPWEPTELIGLDPGSEEARELYRYAEEDTPGVKFTPLGAGLTRFFQATTLDDQNYTPDYLNNVMLPRCKLLKNPTFAFTPGAGYPRPWYSPNFPKDVTFEQIWSLPSPVSAYSKDWAELSFWLSAQHLRRGFLGEMPSKVSTVPTSDRIIGQPGAIEEIADITGDFFCMHAFAWPIAWARKWQALRIESLRLLRPPSDMKVVMEDELDNFDKIANLPLTGVLALWAGWTGGNVSTIGGDLKYMVLPRGLTVEKQNFLSEIGKVLPAYRMRPFGDGQASLRDRYAKWAVAVGSRVTPAEGGPKEWITATQAVRFLGSDLRSKAQAILRTAKARAWDRHEIPLFQDVGVGGYFDGKNTSLHPLGTLFGLYPTVPYSIADHRTADFQYWKNFNGAGNPVNKEQPNGTAATKATLFTFVSPHTPPPPTDTASVARNADVEHHHVVESMYLGEQGASEANNVLDGGSAVLSTSGLEGPPDLKDDVNFVASGLVAVRTTSYYDEVLPKLLLRVVRPKVTVESTDVVAVSGLEMHVPFVETMKRDVALSRAEALSAAVAAVKEDAVVERKSASVYSFEGKTERFFPRVVLRMDQPAKFFVVSLRTERDPATVHRVLYQYGTVMGANATPPGNSVTGLLPLTGVVD